MGAAGAARRACQACPSAGNGDPHQRRHAPCPVGNGSRARCSRHQGTARVLPSHMHARRPATCASAAPTRPRSPFALPLLLLAAPVAFYGFLAARGLSLAEAQAAGWAAKPAPGDGEWKFWQAWGLYGFHDSPPSNIHWAALPSQVPWDERGPGGRCQLAVCCATAPPAVPAAGAPWAQAHPPPPPPAHPLAGGQAGHALPHRRLWQQHGRGGGAGRVPR